MNPRIYIGQTPDTPLARRMLRLRALDLSARLRRAGGDEPVVALLHFQPDSFEPDELIDLLLLRPNALLVGLVKDCSAPLDVLPGGQWVVREDGHQIRGPRGETPLEQIKRSRHLVTRRVAAYADEVQGVQASPQQLSRTVGALICAPAFHPESRAALDIDDHRRQIKLLGWDELPALAAMLQTGVQIDGYSLHALAADVFGGRLWHDGQRLLFELALAPFLLRVLEGPAGAGQTLPLIEGANVIGRRAEPVQHEYRLTLGGDDAVSNDHALLTCAPDGRVLLRDTSTNGSWVAPPGAAEQRLYRASQEIAPGSTIRMGMTRLRLERSEGGEL